MNKKIKKEDISLKVKTPMPEKTVDKNKNNKIPKDLPIYKLPPELEEAPENIKKHYEEFIRVSREIEESKERFFHFINSKTGETEQVDMLGLQGVVQRHARNKNISDVDLVELDKLMVEFQALKMAKSRSKIKWMTWSTPRIGQDVLQWKKGEVIDLYAKYYTHEEIKENLQKEGYELNINNLYKFFLTNKDTIDKKRMQFLSTSKEYYIATEAGRMETLATIHNKLMALFEKVNGMNYSAANSQEIRQLSSSICNVLEHARREIKGDELKLTIDGKINITASLQANQTIRDITKKIPINLIVVYLVSAKAGLDPGMLLTSLINSFYNQFNGFGVINGTDKPANSAEIIKNYDWQQIKTYQQRREETPIPIGTVVEYEEIPFAKKEEVRSKRELLLQLLTQQKDGVAGGK